MKITILTLFPEMFTGVLQSSILKRAIAEKIVDVTLVQIRDFTLDKYRRVDTPPIGGGAGLVMKAQPIVDILKTNQGKKILLSPRGKPFDQTKAKSLAQEKEIVLLCGHYEGIDERVNAYVDEMISIGDYILTGGEIAALAIVDAVTRLLPGTIEHASTQEESFESNLLEYPQYTEPHDFQGQKVPDILYSGNHDAIRKWRLKEALRITLKYRPDLLRGKKLTKEERSLLDELEQGIVGPWEKEAIAKGKKFMKGQ